VLFNYSSNAKALQLHPATTSKLGVT